MKKYFKAACIWLAIIPVAILNGALREHVLNRLGNFALPLSGVILSVCIFCVSYVLIPKIKNCTSKDYMLFGVLWFVLTNLFDLSMFISEGEASWIWLRLMIFLVVIYGYLLCLQHLYRPFLYGKSG